ncbi:hypothetical protein EH243_02375 [Amphritea opalescens]|uniref:Insulinase family protein n=1 Tax=Amphritea opalescens TaxID=2490544 RepID=A0A430KU92_9GAMM|nr:hypothetical protein [Amphritea opalescens]RTE67079.1 hypothetical protein EH243_02375 [Amphritea opalescens]
MSEAKPPLFNRTYLKIIVWIVAIAIVLLTAGHNRSTYIDIKQQADLPLYFVNEDDSDLQLNFLFRTGAAINSDQQLLQKLLEQHVKQQLIDLTSLPSFSALKATLRVGISPDKIKISLTIPAVSADQTDKIQVLVEQLLQQLRYRPSAELEQRWTRLEAEQYLNLKDPENRLLSEFGNQINGSTTIHPLQRFADVYRHSITPSAMTLTLLGPNTKALAQQLSTVFHASSNTQINPLMAIAPTHQRLPPQGNQTYLLTGLVLPGRQQPHFATERLAVSTLQQLLEQQSEFKARLIWKSLDKQGYLAMIQQGTNINADTDLSPLMKSLLAQLDDRLINETRERLVNNYKTQMEQRSAQLAMLDTIAFYQLPLDYLNNVEAKLNQADDKAVRETIRQFLTGPERYQLILPAY